MKRIGFLGCGKIGRAMLEHAQKQGLEIAFVQDPGFAGIADFPCVCEGSEALYATAGLVVECATATALRENFDALIAHCDLLVFSVTAFSDAAFAAHAEAAARQNGRHIYFPHGAILGLDGIRDAREILTAVSIETVKSPESLGLKLDKRTIVYEGSTRVACAAFPRNVNVHATIALAGIGFDRTQSRIIADPAVKTNSHFILAEGAGVLFTITVDSTATGGVSGAYTPLSACGSLDRLLKSGSTFLLI